MSTSISELCRSTLGTLKKISGAGWQLDESHGKSGVNRINEELERLSLWAGNIGALHRPDSPLSIETRLREAPDVLAHIQELLEDLKEVTGELWAIASGEREGMVASNAPENDDVDLDQIGDDRMSEEVELFEEIAACISRLFRISKLIGQAASTDIFMKALSRNRYLFNDQFDIAHVGEKYRKTAEENSTWLQKRLGRAITHRRHYLSYIQDHREKLEGDTGTEGKGKALPIPSTPAAKALTVIKPWEPATDSASRPSTFFTKATTIAPERILPQMLTPQDDSDQENDARSYTTIARSADGDLESSTAARLPKLDELRVGTRKDVECPFCFRMMRFKNERVWRKHVFADLRTYVCTFPDCDAPLFGDINEWFNHEMQNHRVEYQCMLCTGRQFDQKSRYLSHVRINHSEVLASGDARAILEIARKPMEQIPARDCPCCWDWLDRLKERLSSEGSQPSASPGFKDIITVTPTDFKRHLAAHLEQLALFAVPISSAAEGDADSNRAIEEEARSSQDHSSLSALSFHSSGPSLSDKESQGRITVVEDSSYGGNNSDEPQLDTCYDCPESFPTLASLEDHVRETDHHFRCKKPECVMVFSSSTVHLYETHLLNHHEGTITYPCEHCEKYRGSNSFQNKETLMQHLRGYHNMVFDDQAEESSYTENQHQENSGKRGITYSAHLSQGFEIGDLAYLTKMTNGEHFDNPVTISKARHNQEKATYEYQIIIHGNPPQSDDTWHRQSTLGMDHNETREQRRHSRLFVTGLNKDTMEIDMVRLFERYGQVVDCTVMCNRFARCIGTAVVTMGTSEQARRAVTHHNGQLYNGGPISIKITEFDFTTHMIVACRFWNNYTEDDIISFQEMFGVIIAICGVETLEELGYIITIWAEKSPQNPGAAAKHFIQNLARLYRAQMVRRFPVFERWRTQVQEYLVGRRAGDPSPPLSALPRNTQLRFIVIARCFQENQTLAMIHPEKDAEKPLDEKLQDDRPLENENRKRPADTENDMEFQQTPIFTEVPKAQTERPRGSSTTGPIYQGARASSSRRDLLDELYRHYGPSGADTIYGDLVEAGEISLSRTHSFDAHNDQDSTEINQSPEMQSSEDEHTQEVDLPAFLRASDEEINQKFLNLEDVSRQRLRAADDDPESKFRQTDREISSGRDHYERMRPFEYNRVHLPVPEGRNDYINASHIVLKGISGCAYYTATQAPMPQTVSHFWRMVVQRSDEAHVSPAEDLIVALSSDESYHYLPDMRNDRESYDWEFEPGSEDGLTGTTSLTHISSTRYTDVRYIDIRHCAGPNREVQTVTRHQKVVRHLQFRDWPIFRVPEGDARAALIELTRIVDNYVSGAVTPPGRPAIIHCGAGCGRTGTFIALSWLLGCLDRGEFDDVPDDVDPILGVVSDLREQRKHMVESLLQFEFLYDVLREEWLKRRNFSRQEQALPVAKDLKVTDHGGEGATQEDEEKEDAKEVYDNPDDDPKTV